MYSTTLLIRKLGQCDWLTVSDAMHQFTEQRTSTTIDEIWLVEHDPVFTQGQSGKAEHLLMPGDIPVVQSDRGGQVTYHGPGQQVMYILLDLKRRNMRVHKLIMILENTIISTLAEYNIIAYTKENLPGVYVGQGKNRGGKICSLGLRIHKGCSLHGLALNVLMELSPFLRINPCGHAGMRMVQISQFQANITTTDVQPYLIKHFAKLTNSTKIITVK